MNHRFAGAAIAALIGVSVIAPTPVVAGASSAASRCAPVSSGHVLLQTTTAMRKAGHNPAWINRRLLATRCLVLISGAPQPVVATSHPTVGRRPAASSKSNISLPPPTIYWDSQNKIYFELGYWDWTSLSGVLDECGCSDQNSNRDDGGYDGFVMDLSDPMIMVSGGAGMTWWGKGRHFRGGSDNGPTSSSQKGFGFADQDRVYGGNYEGVGKDLNMYHGEEVIEFYGTKKKGCTSGVQGFTRYGHTWSTTSITGFSFDIGADSGGLGISWEHEGHNWAKASQAGHPARVCYHKPPSTT